MHEWRRHLNNISSKLCEFISISMCVVLKRNVGICSVGGASSSALLSQLLMAAFGLPYNAVVAKVTLMIESMQWQESFFGANLVLLRGSGGGL